MPHTLCHYRHISIELLAYQTFWTSGDLVLKDHAAIAWVTAAELDRYDFEPVDIPFVERLRSGEIEMGVDRLGK